MDINDHSELKQITSYFSFFLYIHPLSNKPPNEHHFIDMFGEENLAITQAGTAGFTIWSKTREIA